VDVFSFSTERKLFNKKRIYRHTFEREDNFERTETRVERERRLDQFQLCLGGIKGNAEASAKKCVLRRSI
jgi:hypothetical protein